MLQCGRGIWPVIFSVEECRLQSLSVDSVSRRYSSAGNELLSITMRRSGLSDSMMKKWWLPHSDIRVTGILVGVTANAMLFSLVLSAARLGGRFCQAAHCAIFRIFFA